jgi:hypothetical protein
MAWSKNNLQRCIHRIGPEVTEQVEFGAFRKLGDRTTPRKGL